MSGLEEPSGLLNASPSLQQGKRLALSQRGLSEDLRDLKQLDCKAIKVLGFKRERKQNETRFGQLLNPLGSQGSERWKKELCILFLKELGCLSCFLYQVHQLQNRNFFFSDSEESAAIRLSTIHVGSNSKRASGSQPFTGGIHPSAVDFLSSGGLKVGKVMGIVRGYLSWRCVVKNSRAE